MEIITLREVLAEMEKRERPFSVTFITLDRKKKSGGEIIRIDNGMITGKSLAQEAQASESQSLKDETQSILRSTSEAQATSSKSPNHYLNRTRNIRILGTSQIRKLHIRLITEFNGKKVYY